MILNLILVLLHFSAYCVTGFAPRSQYAEVRRREHPRVPSIKKASSSPDYPKKKKIVPKIGDIVTFEGKWKDESGLGRLATLQYIADRGQWIGDVVIYKEIEQGLYRETKRGRSSEYMDVSAAASDRLQRGNSLLQQNRSHPQYICRR